MGNKKDNKYSETWKKIKKGFLKTIEVVGKERDVYLEEDKRQGGGLGLFR